MGAMPKSLGSPEQEALVTELVRLRQNAGRTQRDLADSLGVSPSWVAKVEIGERRLDVVEFYWWCEALGLDVARAFASTARLIRGARNRR